ncbi:hypothetical protein [Lacimicrobium alkaliphilum]|uniref:Uncharacterized protein n=1 Tax=Lacimicrobium alkaliphilum TaxID=1526571 RepID=A0ABQ1RM66_9ALTE|nr:hypothetical protein [Lacimicrobium alkaliphilum]GGD71558.1 hypothetical protein GCM10011357_28260 [Lacimicrobium alkaliphilum]
MASSAKNNEHPTKVTGQDPFINLRIHQDTLLRLLSRHHLHAEDLHCRDHGSACRLRRLLLGCVGRTY